MNVVRMKRPVETQRKKKERTHRKEHDESIFVCRMQQQR